MGALFKTFAKQEQVTRAFKRALEKRQRLEGNRMAERTSSLSSA